MATSAPAAVAETQADMRDRRREPRIAADGEVVLAPEGPRPILISARLCDCSPSGFRAQHTSPSLETGTIVHFRNASAPARSVNAVGRARVVWNRNVGGHWESGFLILSK